MALELTVTFGVALATPGHSILRDYISTTGATDAPHQALFMASGIVAASLHLVFVWRLFDLSANRWQRAAAGLFAGFFVFLGIGLAFQCDPGCALNTREAWIHFWFGVAAFVSLGFAAIASLVGLWPGGLRRWSAVQWSAVALILFDILLLASDLTKFLQGLTERLAIVAMMVWSVLFMRALARPTTPSTTHH